MTIKLSKEKAEEILNDAKSQIESIDLSTCSMSAEPKGKVVLVYEQRRTTGEKITEWLLDRADVLLMSLVLLIVYVSVSCSRCGNKAASPTCATDTHTETTVCHTMIEFPNGRVVTNSIEVTHSVTNEFARP